MDISLSLETKKWSRCRWWCHFKGIWKLVHHWAPCGIWPSLSHVVNHTSLISVMVWSFWHVCLCSHTQTEILCLPQQTNSSWPEQTCRGWVLSHFHFNFTMFWKGEKSSFYLDHYGLYFFHFVLLDSALEALLNKPEKIMPSDTFSLKLIT